MEIKRSAGRFAGVGLDEQVEEEEEEEEEEERVDMDMTVSWPSK